MRYKIIIALLAMVTSLSAQSDTLLFTYPFYFEDAIGNRDTVLYSGRSAGSLSDDNLDKGMDISDIPFTSVIDARIYHDHTIPSSPNSEVTQTYEHFITPYYPQGECYGQSIIRPRFAVKATHWPVTISWESELFEEGNQIFCNPHMVLLDNTAPDGATYWYEDFFDQMQYACMSYLDSVTFQTDSGNEFQQLFGTTDFLLRGEERILQSVRVFSFISSGLDICLTAPTQTADVVLSRSVTLAPNPATSLVQLSISDEAITGPLDITIFTATGRIQAELRNHQIGESIEVSSWPAGMYYLRGRTADGRVFTKKLVVN